MSGVPIEVVKTFLMWLTMCEHMGDVNNDIIALCRDLGLPEPKWSDERNRLVLPWEEDEDE